MCDNVKTCPMEVECSCPNTDCENYKLCCACVASHRSKDYLPHCLREEE